MDPITAAALIGGGATLLGGMQQNAASAQAAREQMGFQREMSDTSYQRQVADLKAAGINPMLGYMKGTGASTPQGAMPTFVNPYSAATQAYGQIASGYSAQQQARKTGIEADVLGVTGLSQARANLDETLGRIGLSAAQTQYFKNQAELSAASVLTEKEKPAQVRAMVQQLIATTQTERFRQLNYEQQTAVLQAQVPLIMAKAQLEKNQVAAELQTNNMRRLMEQAGPAANVVKGALDAGYDWFGRKFESITSRDTVHDKKTGRTTSIETRKGRR